MIAGTRHILVALAALPAGAAAEPKAPTYRHKVAYATYLGGGRAEQLREVIPYPDGSVLVGGQSNSNDLPTTPGVVQRRYGGEEPLRGHGGLVGGDCFLARLGPKGGKLIFCTYFGGSKQERNVYGMALDSKGNIVITSATRSPDLPTTPAAFQRKYGGGRGDGALAIFSPDGAKLLYATYLGGGGNDLIRGIAIGPKGELYLVGSTSSKDFPVTDGAFQKRLSGGGDPFVVKLMPVK